MQDRLKAATAALHQAAAALSNDGITAGTEKLGTLATGADSIFARHARETFVATRADATIDENVAISAISTIPWRAS